MTNTATGMVPNPIAGMLPNPMPQMAAIVNEATGLADLARKLARAVTLARRRAILDARRGGIMARALAAWAMMFDWLATEHDPTADATPLWSIVPNQRVRCLEHAGSPPHAAIPRTLGVEAA